MIHDEAVGERGTCAGCQPEGTRIDGVDQSSTQKDTSGRSAVEEVVGAHRGDDLQSKENKCQANSKADGRYVCGSCAVSCIRLTRKLDDGL